MMALRIRSMYYDMMMILILLMSHQNHPHVVCWMLVAS